MADSASAASATAQGEARQTLTLPADRPSSLKRTISVETLAVPIRRAKAARWESLSLAEAVQEGIDSSEEEEGPAEDPEFIVIGLSDEEEPVC